jgi:hypothetical protein
MVTQEKRESAKFLLTNVMTSDNMHGMRSRKHDSTTTDRQDVTGSGPSGQPRRKVSVMIPAHEWEAAWKALQPSNGKPRLTFQAVCEGPVREALRRVSGESHVSPSRRPRPGRGRQ